MNTKQLFSTQNLPDFFYHFIPQSMPYEEEQVKKLIQWLPHLYKMSWDELTSKISENKKEMFDLLHVHGNKECPFKVITGDSWQKALASAYLVEDYLKTQTFYTWEHMIVPHSWTLSDQGWGQHRPGGVNISFEQVFPQTVKIGEDFFHYGEGLIRSFLTPTEMPETDQRNIYIPSIIIDDSILCKIFEQKDKDAGQKILELIHFTHTLASPYAGVYNVFPPQNLVPLEGEGNQTLTSILKTTPFLGYQNHIPISFQRLWKQMVRKTKLQPGDLINKVANEMQWYCRNLDPVAREYLVFIVTEQLLKLGRNEYWNTKNQGKRHAYVEKRPEYFVSVPMSDFVYNCIHQEGEGLIFGKELEVLKKFTFKEMQKVLVGTPIGVMTT